MREPQPILIAHLFAPLNDELVSLLHGLSADEWNAPTVAGLWTVKDIAGHLLDTKLRRLSMHRDAHTLPLPDDAFANGLGAFVNGMNREGVSWMRRLSPSILIEMHETYGRQMAAFFESLDPFAKARIGVSWAGEEESANWFDVARELTEQWHHQQQIRDAVGRPPLYKMFLAPVIDTFVRALPYTYRDVDAPEGTAITLRITDVWSLVREESRWRLYADEATLPATRITISGDVAWRLFTRQRVEPNARVEGDARYAEPVFGMTSIVA